MDHLQYGLIAEYVTEERFAALREEGAAWRRADLAGPGLPWRERAARRLVAMALRIAPHDSPVRQGWGATSLPVRG